MRKLEPLLAGDADELEALLLRSADADEPAQDALVRVGATLGVSTAALSASAAGGTATYAALAPKAGAVVKPLTLLSLGKWLAVGVGAGCIVSGGARLALGPARHEATAAAAASALAPRAVVPVTAAPIVATKVTDAPAPSDALAPSATGASREAAHPATNVSALGASVLPPSAPALASPPVAAVPGPSSASFAPLDEPSAARAQPAATEPSAVAASTLGEETRALDRVRSDIAAGEPARALAEIERYGAKWPHAALAEEAALLRVEALLRSGNRVQGEREGEALIARAPRSRYASRARALLGATPASPRGE